jgi:hypothetical protein
MMHGAYNIKIKCQALHGPVSEVPMTSKEIN